MARIPTLSFILLLLYSDKIFTITKYSTIFIKGIPQKTMRRKMT